MPGETHLVTEPFDQAQLHGLLNRLRDFGLDLIAVQAIPADHGRRGEPAIERAGRGNSDVSI
jgi:hypothetical protein